MFFFCSLDNVKLGPDNSVMTITNAQAKNQGTYRCVASNLFGMTHSIVSLIVRGIATFNAIFKRKDGRRGTRGFWKTSLETSIVAISFGVHHFLNISVQILLLLHSLILLCDFILRISYGCSDPCRTGASQGRRSHQSRMPGLWRAKTLCEMAQIGQQPQDDTEQPCACRYQCCHAGYGLFVVKPLLFTESFASVC